MTPHEMEAEALSPIASPLDRKRLLPTMTEKEITRQAQRFKAVAWVEAGENVFHKVGIAHNGQLAFSHHTTKEIRRQLAFMELGGTACPCVDWYKAVAGLAFIPGISYAWQSVWSCPPHFRTVINTGVSLRLVRAWKPLSRAVATELKQVRHPVKNTRAIGRRTRYEEG